ncbi:MAG TPA: O-antigen ligase family protein [Candidatus Sulfotelmatobacter sp.]
MRQSHNAETSLADSSQAAGSFEANALQEAKPVRRKSLKGMPLPAALIAFFLFFQLFDYHALHWFTSITPDRVCFLLLCLSFIAAAQKGKLRFSWTGTEVCMVLFALLCTISYCVTNPDGGSEQLKWLTTLFNLIAFPFGLYLFTKFSRYSAAKTLWLMRALVGVGVYLAFTGIFEHFGINALVWPGYIVDPHVGIQFGRSRGPMVGSNPMGEWLVVVYLAACLIMPYARKASKVLLWGLILLVMIAIYCTLTRGPWICFAAMLLLTAGLGGKFGIQSRLTVLVILLAFFTGAGSKFSYRQETLFSRRQNTIEYRISNNLTTYNMGMANPLTGVGYGNFMPMWSKYFDGKAEELTKDLTDGNHNTFLGLFADMGFPGVLLYSALFGYLLRDCFRTWRLFSPENLFEKNFALCALGLVLISIIEAISGDLRFNPTLNSLTFVFAGIAASMKPWQKAQRTGRETVIKETVRVEDETEPLATVTHSWDRE